MLKLTLKAARVNAGLTQKEAAAAISISNKTLCKWEKGVTAPDVHKAKELCDLYAVSYDNVNFAP